MRGIAAAAAGLVFVCLPLAAGAQMPNEAPAGVPKINGSYVLTRVVNCFTSELTISQWNAYADFNPTTGMVSITGYYTTGEPPHLNAVSQNVAFSNTESTITIDGNVSQVFYGKLARGVATYLSYLGTQTVSGGACAVQVTLSRRSAL